MNLDANILVVDDFSTMRRIITKLLTGLGFHYIQEAADGSEALDLIEAGGIDFVVTDWHMPVMDGLSLVREIRGNSATRHIPVLMVTAESKKTHIMEAAYAGVNGYIIKPFAADELEKKIVRIFDRIESH